MPLVDQRSGLVVEPGLLTCVVSAHRDEAAAIADRLGRFGDDGGVTLGGVPLDQLPVETVRRRIVVSEPDPLLFSGTLRSELDPWATASDDEILAAISVANAEDVLDAAPDGLATGVDERGRSFSGGQRQRLVLARALLSDAEVLVLVEPTSAVDAHTEARIARRLHERRAGRTTVVVSTSPLVLDQADRVASCAAAASSPSARTASCSARARTTARPSRGERTRERVGREHPPPDRGRPRAARARRGCSAGVTGAALAGVLGLHALAAGAGLAGPPLLGALVQSVVSGTTTSYVDRIVLLLALFVAVQTVVTWFARRASFVLSEEMFAELREDFMERVLALPLSTVERAGTGDLVSRSTADVDSLARTIRFALPETLIAAVTTLLTVVAVFWVNPLAAIPCLAGVPVLWLGTRWYLRRAPAGYLWERAAYATLAGTVGETVDGGRTIDALGLGEERVRRIDGDLEEAYRAERRTLYLRTVWFPSAEFAYVIPVAASLAWGGWLVSTGHATIGEVTAVALYVVQLADPVDRLISWLDEIQVGATSFARLVGVARVPPDRSPTGEQPDGDELRASDVRYAYVQDRDVLHGIDLELEPGERVAVVGPVRRGQVDARPAARRHPSAADGAGRRRRRPARRPDARVAAAGGRARDAGAARLRRHARGEPAASRGRVRPTDELAAALEAVDALQWAESLPDGLETMVGAGGHPLTPAQAQQLALARLVLADPHTLVLDEATSLLDPRAARHLERSLASVLDGTDGRGDRAPPPHRARRRPGGGRRGRPAARARHARRARGARRLVRRALGLVAQRSVIDASWASARLDERDQELGRIRHRRAQLGRRCDGDPADVHGHRDRDARFGMGEQERGAADDIPGVADEAPERRPTRLEPEPVARRAAGGRPPLPGRRSVCVAGVRKSGSPSREPRRASSSAVDRSPPDG